MGSLLISSTVAGNEWVSASAIELGRDLADSVWRAEAVAAPDEPACVLGSAG